MDCCLTRSLTGHAKTVTVRRPSGGTYVKGRWQTQTTEEKNSPPGTDTTRYRYAALGPEINWRPTKLPGFQVALRSYFEFAARNSSQGMFSVLSIMYVFGG